MRAPVVSTSGYVSAMSGVDTGRSLRFLVVGQRVLAKLAEHGRVQLHAAGGRVEARLAVGTQAAGLVLAVAAHLGLLVHHLFAQLFEALLVVQAVVGQEVVVVLVLLEVDRHAAQAQLVHDLAVALAVAHRDGLVHGARHDGGRAVMGVHHRVMLDRGRERQEHLAARLDGGRHPHVDAEAPLQVLDHGVVPALGLRGAGAGQEVRVFEAAHLEGIVFGVVACLQRVEHHVALGVQHQAHVGRVFLDAQDLALQFRAQVAPAESQLQAVVHVADELAARNVDVARDGLERQDAVTGLHAVGLLIDAQAPGDLRRLRLGVGARRLADEVGVHARDLGSLLHRHGRHALGELFEAVAPFLDEIVVVEVFGNDDVEHGHGQRRVGARTQPQMPVGARRHPIHARLDAHELGAAAHHVDGGMAEQAVAVGRQGLLGPEHDELGQLEHRVVVASRRAARVVHLGIRGAQHVRGAGDARDVARVAGLRVAGVRRADAGLRIGREHGAAFAAGAAHDEDGFGPVVLLVVGHLLGNEVECLVPGDALPLVLAAVLAGALHGIAHAVRVVHVVADGEAANAQAAVRDGMVLVAFDLHQFAGGVHVGLDAASRGMASRRRPGASAGDGQAVLFEAPRFAEVGRALAFENLHALSSSRLVVLTARSRSRAACDAARDRPPHERALAPWRLRDAGGCRHARRSRGARGLGGSRGARCRRDAGNAGDARHARSGGAGHEVGAFLFGQSSAPHSGHALSSMPHFAPHAGQGRSISIAAGLKHMRTTPFVPCTELPASAAQGTRPLVRGKAPLAYPCARALSCRDRRFRDAFARFFDKNITPAANIGSQRAVGNRT